MLPRTDFLVGLSLAIFAFVGTLGDRDLNVTGSVERDHGPKGKRNGFSTPEECARSCEKGDEPRYCRYHFTIESYTTMNRACGLCKPNSDNQLANVPQCQCIEADGFERGILSINRMLPGPSIQVCQNDTVVVDVSNHIPGMEVALHWHGMWQQGSQYYDGVPFLTQCPIPSGTTFRYQFVASNPGTHFYHSHTGLQKIDGQYGSLIVRQPRSIDPHGKLYDHDLPTHVILLSDWMHEMSIERFPGRMRNNPGQIPENVLINGKGRWTDPATNRTTPVQLESFVVQPGKRYRFRLINSFSSVCPARLNIGGHYLKLIAQDGEPVTAMPINTIVSSSGERVDFILETNSAVGAYWIEVRAIGPCAASDIRQLAVLRYGGGPKMPRTAPPIFQSRSDLGLIYNDPRTTCNSQEPNSMSVCADQLKSLEPVPQEMLRATVDHRIILPFKIHSYANSTGELFKPGSYPRYLVIGNRDHIASQVDGISFSFPPVPPLSQDLGPADTCNRTRLPQDCAKLPCQCPHTHHIKKGAIVEVVLYNEVSENNLPHPFHLHGYAFHVFKIGRVIGRADDFETNLNRAIEEHKTALAMKKYRKPARKDTIVVPDGGYVILRFKADNPGWWLFHCHFVYHIAIGMNVVFHVGEKKDLPPVPPMFPKCYSYIPDVA